MKKQIELLFLKVVVYVLRNRNIERCLYISRKDNNRLYNMADDVELVMKNIRLKYGDDRNG